MSESVEQIPESLMYNFAFQSISLIIVIVYSIRKGGVKEVVENLFLWLLFTFAVFNLSMTPVDEDDEITGAIFLVAFGVCRIAKHMARAPITEKNQGNM